MLNPLGALHEFEYNKLRVHQRTRYSAEKHLNDLLDAEQFIYLGDVASNVLSVDGGLRGIHKLQIQFLQFALEDEKPALAMERSNHAICWAEIPADFAIGNIARTVVPLSSESMSNVPPS